MSKKLVAYFSASGITAKVAEDLANLVEDVLERRNVVVIPHGVDTVIHGDIPDAVAGEEIFNQEAGLQVIPTQSG